MLAISERSVIVLINPATVRLARVSTEFKRHIQASRALLRVLAKVSGVAIRLLGDIGDARKFFAALPNCQVLAGDPVEFWRDENVSYQIGPVDTPILYLAGAWLDDEVLAAALTAGQIGYETRVLVDVSVARTEFDRTWALERLEQEHVLMTTVRQTMAEWSLATSDHDMGRQLRSLLR